MNAIAKLAAIADEFDANALDGEARKYWGKNLESLQEKDPNEIILYAGRGGKTLLTLQDCFDAREALRKFEAKRK